MSSDAVSVESLKVESEKESRSALETSNLEEDDTLTALPNTSITTTAATNIKKEVIRPLFSRASTTEKTTKPNTTMIVETETVDASNVPSVTLPIASIVSNDANVASLRSKKSTLFVDQVSTNSNQIPNSSANDENIIAQSNNDTASINGSVRNINKRLVQQGQQETIHSNISSKPGVTKADLFAAKVANAVGDASDSDSEETFVYESAPDALNSTNSAKTSSGNINSSALALRKLSQRNISMPISSTSSLSNLTNTSSLNNNTSNNIIHHTSNLSTINDNNSTINLTTDNDETDSLLSQNHTPESNQITQDKLELIQNQISLDESQTSVSDHAPTTQNLYIASLQDKSNLSPTSDSQSIFQPPQQPLPQLQSQQQAQVPQPPPNITIKSTETIQPLYQPKTRVFTKYKGESQQRKPSNISLLANSKNSLNSNINKLRTTTSKLFDVKGSSLRRYSGVPDDVNIEDYIDQHDEDEELGLDDYSDTYDFEDYEEDNELTPLNVSKSNNKLRNKVSKNYFNKNSYTNFRSTDSGDNFNDNNFKEDGFLPSSNLKNKPKKYKSRNQQTQRLQQPYSPHNFHNSKRQTRVQSFKNFIYLFSFVFLLLTFGFVAGFLLATTKDLQSVSVTSVKDVVVSYDELAFDLYVEAFNPGFMSVLVEHVELDVFAKTEFLKTQSAYNNIPVVIDDGNNDDALTQNIPPLIETILLGSVTKLEVPLVFESGLFNRNHTLAKGSVKLLHPGQNSTEEYKNPKLENDSEKWRDIIKHPFDLILKGRLKYELPFFGSKRSVSVTKTISIDPTAKKIIALQNQKNE